MLNGTIGASEAVEHVDGQELADILGDLVNTVGPDKPIVHIDSTYQKWVVSVDTTALADTITAGSDAERDVSLDENPYVVMGYANTNGTEVPPIPGVQAMFSVDNIDDVAPEGPTTIKVTNVVPGFLEENEDGSYTVGGLVDKYDEEVDSPVATLTIEPEADRKTYKSVKLVVTDDEGQNVEGLRVGAMTETAEGSGVFEVAIFQVTVDVGTLADGEYLENDTYMFHALTYDGSPDGPDEQYGNIQEDKSEISVTVANARRPLPGVLAITVSDPTRTNPDSGAPQGTLVLYGYSPERTSPPTTAVRFEVKRENDREWRAVGTDSESIAGTGVIGAGQTHQEWSVSVNTTTLPDTITANSLAARNASRDNNQYMVRAVAIAEAEGSETPSADDVTAMFSVDNVDDVGPLGPTNIVTISKADGPIRAANGVYKVGRLVDKYDTTLTPLRLTFTIRPGSSVDPKTYVGGSVRLFQNGVDTGIASVSNASGSWNVTLPDVGKLANGTYNFHAISVDAFGNRQTDRNSPRVTVQIENTRRPAPGVLAITVDDPTKTNPDSGAPTGHPHCQWVYS